MTLKSSSEKEFPNSESVPVSEAEKGFSKAEERFPNSEKDFPN